ncbi:MAG: carboxymuconolactone decarboxylase family protein [Vicinamibacterales bacterium]
MFLPKPLTATAVLLVVSLAVLMPPPASAQRVPQPRLDPLPASEWTDAHRQALGARARGDETADVFRTCLRNVELCRAWMGFTDYILSERISISQRDRELVILRIGALCRSDYEWSAHAALGLRVGLTAEEIARIPRGPDAPGWSAADATLLRATDELHNDQHISDATWARLRERFNERQIMDVIFTAGQYTLVSMFLNSAGVQLPKGQTGIPR